VADVPGSGLLDLADAALGAADACQLGPDGFARNETRFVFSCDPNDKVGSSGVGTAQFISGDVPTPYTVFFENKPDASAPAQDVVITDQLDLSRLDVATFQLGPIRFGDHTVVPPPGRSEFNTDVDLRPDKDLIARIQARLDKDTGLLTWRFASIDPDTLLPTEDPLAGILPPNGDAGEGEGNVLFTVRPRTGLTSGTTIENAARIVFDTNAPIDTPVWRNTIDDAAPVSRVESLPPVVGTETFLVQWSGVDAHSGIANFTVLVSEDGGPFQVWQRNTTEVSAPFDGRHGRSYAFYSQARDLTGNLEAAKAAEASTRVEVDPGDRTPPSVSCPAGPAVPAEPGRTTAVASYPLATATDDRPGVTVRCAPPPGSSFALGATEVTCTATDGAGNTAACVFAVTVVDTEPPLVAAPPDRAAEATSAAGAVVSDDVLGSPSAADNAPGVTVVRSGVPAGNLFPIGTTSIVHTAIDLAGNAASALQRVTVVDTTPPTITIDAPVAEARYGVGQVVAARYACADTASVAVACAGTVADGDEIDTATAGRKTFTVTATDAAGNVATRAVAYSVGYSLAFTSARSGNGDIHVMNGDGSGLRVVAAHSAVDFDPALSPDGSRVAFVSARSGAGDIYVAGTEGGPAVPVASHVAPDLDPTFSPDGSRLAFVSYRSGGGDIYLADADGSGLVRLTDSGHPDFDPVFSPDGTRVAFVSTRSGHGDLYVVNTDGSGLRRLTTGAGLERTPAFSPDGTRIAFVSMGTGLGDVYVVNVDGTGLRRLTHHLAPDLAPRFSPDGTKLVFTSGRSGFGDVHVMDADGTNVRALAGHPALDLQPMFGAAGEIAFVSQRAGRGDVYVVQLDGTGLRNLTDHPAADGDLDWR
jgi:Tol biopolymer transport system component